MQYEYIFDYSTFYVEEDYCALAQTWDGSLQFMTGCKDPIICKWCENEMKFSKVYADGKQEEGFWVVEVCPFCGWWWHYRTYTGYGGAEKEFTYGQLRKYNICDNSDIPTQILTNHLAKHPKNLSIIGTKKFEKLVADIYMDFHPGCSVVHIGKSGDRGVDVYGIMSNSDHILIQVKRRTDIKRNEGPKVIRELIGASFDVLDKSSRARAKLLVYTTANNFTKGARRVAESLSKHGMENVELIAYDEIVSALKLSYCNNNPPWHYSDFSRTPLVYGEVDPKASCWIENY